LNQLNAYFTRGLVVIRPKYSPSFAESDHRKLMAWQDHTYAEQITPSSGAWSNGAISDNVYSHITQPIAGD
jgi:hypothetical protein